MKNTHLYGLISLGTFLLVSCDVNSTYYSAQGSNIFFMVEGDADTLFSIVCPNDKSQPIFTQLTISQNQRLQRGPSYKQYDDLSTALVISNEQLFYKTASHEHIISGDNYAYNNHFKRPSIREMKSISLQFINSIRSSSEKNINFLFGTVRDEDPLVLMETNFSFSFSNEDVNFTKFIQNCAQI